MKNSVIKMLAITVLVLFLVASVEPSAAQCAMCKASAEANLKAGGGDPRGLNAGILYMLMLPYFIVMGVGYWWWRNRKNERQDASEFSEDDFARYN